MARYAEADDVAQHVRMWTDDGHFTGDTSPTQDQVESWLDDFSGLLDASLASEGFVTPVTDDEAKAPLKLFTQSLVAKLAHQANKMGEPDMGWFGKLQKDVSAWVTENAIGLENMGANRAAQLTDTVAFSDTDQAGDKVNPIFQRKGFGNVFQDWDT